jgi:hypothetical protein
MSEIKLNEVTPYRKGDSMGQQAKPRNILEAYNDWIADPGPATESLFAAFLDRDRSYRPQSGDCVYMLDANGAIVRQCIMRTHGQIPDEPQPPLTAPRNQPGPSLPGPAWVDPERPLDNAKLSALVRDLLARVERLEARSS